MDPIETLLFVALIPGAIATAIVIAGRGHRLSGAVAIAVATSVGAVAISGVPALWPLEVSDRLIHIIALGLVAAIAVSHASKRVALAVVVAVGFAVSAIVIGPLLAHRFAGARGPLALAASTAAAVILWLALARSSRAGALTDRVVSSAALLIATATSVAAGLSGSVVIAQLGGAACAGVGGLWLWSLRGSPNRVHAAAPVISVALWAIIALSVLYAAMSTRTALLLFLAPLALAAAARFVSGKQRAPIALGAALLLSAAAVVSTLAPDGSSSDESAEYGYE